METSVDPFFRVRFSGRKSPNVAGAGCRSELGTQFDDMRFQERTRDGRLIASTHEMSRCRRK